jgi:hypothetical protein
MSLPQSMSLVSPAPNSPKKLIKADIKKLKVLIKIALKRGGCEGLAKSANWFQLLLLQTGNSQSGWKIVLGCMTFLALDF